MGFTIHQLQLAPTMRKRALELQAAHPTVVFTSGRRDLLRQAKAMAKHVVADRQWIQKTYIHGALLQTAIDFRPEAVTEAQIEAVLYQTMVGMSETELSSLSDHFGGNAVDMVPMEYQDESEQWMPTDEGQQVMDWIQACPDTKAFLRREGGRMIWHWACKPSAEV